MGKIFKRTLEPKKRKQDIIIIQERITTRNKIKIKEDKGTILEVTIAEEIFMEETITEGTMVDIIQKTTTEVIIFNSMIIKMLNWH